MRAPTALALFAVLSSTASAAAQDWRVALDTLVYDDTDNVTAVTPRLAVHRRLDDEGGRVGARVLLDVVSAASVDVISQATPGFTEARTEAAFDLSKAFDDHLPSGSFRFSIEPDYQSYGGLLGWRSRVGSPDTVVQGSYGLTYDIVARSGTPWDVFSEELFTHAANLSLTQTLGPETVLRVVYSLQIQHGYLEKPYRYVPLFDAATVRDLGIRGQPLNLDTFDQFRLPGRVPEEVPDLRVGNALGARVLQWIDGIQGSIRADYQFYFDDWGLTGHALEAALTGTAVEWLRLVGYARLYWQTRASFWRREYTVDASGEIPQYRTLDRDLSDYYSLTGGARGEWTLNREWGGYVDGSVMWTHFDDFIFLTDRVALMGQVGIRWTP